METNSWEHDEEIYSWTIWNYLPTSRIEMELELVEYVEFLDGKWNIKAPGVGMLMLELSFEIFVEHEILDLHDEEWSELEIVRTALSLKCRNCKSFDHLCRTTFWSVLSLFNKDRKLSDWMYLNSVKWSNVTVQ